MPWFGTIKTDGSGIVTLIRTPDDAEVDMNRDAQGVLFTQVNWDPSRGQFAYTRKITYAFFDKGGYVAQAKWYRAYAKSEGLFVTLAQKAKANPNVNLLLGAADVWTWAWGGHEAEICAEMKSIGMTHVLWSEPDLQTRSRRSTSSDFSPASMISIRTSILPMPLRLR